MYSNNVEEAVADFTKFLSSGHPSLALQFIPAAMVRWTHLEDRRQLGKFDRRNAWKIFLNLLRKSLDERLTLISSQSVSDARKKRTIASIPQETFVNKGKEILVLLESMTPEDAISFLVELTTNWCFSIPMKFLPLLPITLHDKSDEAIANGIFAWFEEYHDLILWS
jgi:hypothetical protein